MTDRTPKVIAEFRGKGHRAKFTIERRRGKGWMDVAKHDDREFALKQAEGLALTNRCVHRVIEWEWVKS